MRLIERTIINAIIEDCLAAGFSISVNAAPGGRAEP